jgi:hypothetical protein
MSFDVSVALKNVHDFEAVRDIAKKDHIILVGNAADVRAKLRTRTAYIPLDCCQFVALGAKLPHEGFPGCNVPACIGDVGHNRKKGRRERR